MHKSLSFLTCLFLLISMTRGWAQTAQPEPREKVIIDTDIGDDIDDAFALAFALSSPQFDILGITTAWGDTQLRARMVDRMLCETGREDIPIAAGIPTESHNIFDQAPWARAFWKPQRQYPSAVDFILQEARKYPNQITLIAIAPLSNIGAAIKQDPKAFRQLKRVVVMGGSIYRGYGDLGYAPNRGPDPEYNIVSDVPAARALLNSEVPVFLMPLDSTQLKLDEVKRQLLFRQSTPLTQDLAVLYYEWGQLTPTLFDPIAVGYALDPQVCPAKPMHIDIDEKGYTRVGTGRANAEVCLDSREGQFFQLFMSRILAQNLVGSCSR